MKTLVNSKFAAIFLMLLLLSACDDFLDRKPLGQYTSDTYPAGGLTEYVYGMYSQLRAFNIHVFAFIGITSITSDDADKGSTPADGPAQKEFDDFTILANNGLVSGFYTGHYQGISRCNLVLEVTDSLQQSITPEEYTLSRAEARFIRAYLYFNLVRTFGGVPKVEVTGSTANIPRASKEEIYAFIEEDLLFAQNNLPATWPDYPGRSSRGAAQGLLAKVYLYQQRWGDALQMCQNVIGSGQYDLNTPYNVIFTEEGENTSESLFEIQAVRNAEVNYNCEYAQVQGARGSGAWDLGWGFNTPSEQLLNAYEADDPRMEVTILFRGETTPYGEIPPLSLPNERYNQKVYTNPTFRQEANNRFGGWMNVRILRYADVVLMAAEAANELDQTDEALEKLEWIRARARGTNNAILPEITETDQALLRDLIRHERRIELAMEHERFFDLVRWGIAEDVLHAAGKTNFVTGKHELMPIPQAEIDISGGVLIQNPGY